jgi:hypothetical protein
LPSFINLGLVCLTSRSGRLGILGIRSEGGTWEYYGDQFGGAVASRDVNGDLVDDFLGGAPNALSKRGRTYVLFGGPYIDLDSDGHHDGIDCDDGDGQVWKSPGETKGLTLSHDHDASTTALTWQEPTEPGCVLPLYDLLRSDLPMVFTGAICLESDDHTAWRWIMQTSCEISEDLVLGKWGLARSFSALAARKTLQWRKYDE